MRFILPSLIEKKNKCLIEKEKKKPKNVCAIPTMIYYK